MLAVLLSGMEVAEIRKTCSSVLCLQCRHFSKLYYSTVRSKV